MAEETFIRQFQRLLMDNVNANLAWARLLSYQVLSTAIGKSLTLHTKKGPLRLGLFSLIIAPSGMDKSVTLNNYVRVLLSKLSKLVKSDLLLPSDFTSEALKDWFMYEPLEQDGGYVEKHDSGALIRDEWTKLLRDVYHKMYLNDQLEFLCYVYDGIIPSRATKQSGVQALNEVSVNLMAGTTPYLFKLMSQDFFMQGLGNRFLYVIVDSIDTRDEDPNKYFHDFMQTELKNEVLNGLANLLFKYYQVAKQSCLFVAEEARGRLLEFDKQKRAIANTLYREDRYEMKHSYLVRLHEFAMKISALEAVNRVGLSERKDEKQPYMIDITKEDVDRAIDFVELEYKEFERMLQLWENIRVEERVRFRMRDVQDMKNMIAENAGIISKTDLRRKIQLPSEKLHEMIAEAFQGGEIEIYEGKEDPTKTGPVTTYIVLASMKIPIPKWLHKKTKAELAAA